MKDKIYAKYDEIVEHVGGLDLEHCPDCKKLFTELAALKLQDEPVTDEDIEKWADKVQPIRGGYKSDYIFSAKAMRDGLIRKE